DARRGLSFGEDGFPVHQSNRMGEPGHVELWPLERATPAEEPEDWKEPIDAERAPEVLVAERIASTIHGWLKDGERLEGTGEAIRPGDILVLVRKRDRFMHALSRALKNRHVPVAGADRLRLTDHIAVQDLMAIGRFVLQPADDLSLAALLKSPLFDFSDDDLFVLAHGRGAATLFQSMREKARGEVRFASAVETLSRWRARADRVSVFEFYDSILGPEAGRARLIARLGTETADMLDEFLAFALAQERVGLPGLENFLATLDTARPEIKREMDARRGEVRIMTVHASKGLEAPVVVLVDPGSKAFSHAHLPDLMEIEHAPPDWTSPLFLWRIGEHAKNAVMAQNGARLKARAEEEYRRLLYVAMTRAADRLIVAGYATPRGGGEGTWHAMIEAALGPHCREIARDGFTAKRFELDRTRPAESAGEDARKEAAPDTAPGWLGEPAAPEPPPPRPLQPSGASLVIGEFRARSESPSWSSPLLTAQTQSGEPVGREGAARTALQRGAAIHRLLQVLPDCPQADRDNRALAWLAALEPDWSDAERRAILASVLRVLDDPRFAPLFAEGSAAEVAVMGTVEIAGRPRAVSGVIDRLAVTPGSVLVADYKTDRTPASSPADVPPTYRAQLALYRALLRSLYPDRAIETVIVYTETATLVPVPAQALDEALAALAGT
nr:3'-5' exonuclease [Rhizobiaceae bacterium]